MNIYFTPNILESQEAFYNPGYPVIVTDSILSLALEHNSAPDSLEYPAAHEIQHFLPSFLNRSAYTVAM